MKITYVEPGTKLWFVVIGPRSRSEFYKYRGDIIVPVIAEEVNDIYVNPNEKDGAIWRYRFVDGTDYISVPTNQKDENGWTIYDRKDPSWLGDAKPVNQYVWIDEPVGHGIQVGDVLDGLFLTLQEAKRYAIPSKKKHLMRRLKAYRNRSKKFIVSTWERNNEVHPGFNKYADKKIYVRKK